MKRHYYNGKSFWQDNPNDTRPLYLLNDEIIEKAEKSLGIYFPCSFIELMKE